MTGGQPLEPALALVRQAAATIPRLDAEVLMADMLGVSRAQLLLDPTLVADRDAFARRLARRLQHEPVAYILGRREFWSLDLLVTPDVLIPRPDSETLIEAARDMFSGQAPGRILDLGTGSGALLLAALSLFDRAEGVGLDRSAGALAVASDNAARLGFAGRARFAPWDWMAEPLPDLAGRFDLLLCNPPYIPAGTELMPDVARFEPAEALFGGPDGLDAYRRLFPLVPGILAADGIAIFEFGPGQEEPLRHMAGAVGLCADTRADLAGRPRALLLRRG